MQEKAYGKEFAGNKQIVNYNLVGQIMMNNVVFQVKGADNISNRQIN